MQLWRLLLTGGVLWTSGEGQDNVFSKVPMGTPLKWCDGGMHAALKEAITLLLRDLFAGSTSYRYTATTAETIGVVTLTAESILRELGLMSEGSATAGVSLHSIYDLVRNMLSLFQKAKQSGLTKPEHLSTSLCRLIDRETNREGGESPMGCFSQDLAVTLSACGTSLRSNLPDLQDCETMTNLRGLDVIPEFPNDEICYTANNGRLIFSDRELVVPLKFVNKTFVDSIPEEVREVELINYFTLWRACILMYRAVAPKCSEAYPKARQIDFVPGWEIASTIWLSQLSGDHSLIFPQRTSLPLVYLLKQKQGKEPCRVLALVRGTQTDYEWFVDYYYHKYPTRRPNTFIHLGVQTILNAVSDSLRIRLFETLQESNCNCAQSEIIFAGHSLGGALSIAFSTLLKHDLRQRGCAATVYSVAFSSPRVLDGFDPDVVYRSLIDRKDVLYSLPCFNGFFEGQREGNNYSGWPRCGPGHAVLSGAGADAFPTPWGRVVVNGELGRVSARERMALDRRAFDTKQAYDGLLPLENIGPELVGMPDIGAQPEVSSGLPLLSRYFGKAGAQFSTSLNWLTNAHRDASDVLVKGVNALDLIYYAPTRDEIVVGHAGALSCALSSACRAHPDSKFVWRCEHTSARDIIKSHVRMTAGA